MKATQYTAGSNGLSNAHGLEPIYNIKNGLSEFRWSSSEAYVLIKRNLDASYVDTAEASNGLAGIVQTSPGDI